MIESYFFIKITSELSCNGIECSTKYFILCRAFWILFTVDDSSGGWGISRNRLQSLILHLLRNVFRQLAVCSFPWYFSRSVFEDALRVYGMAHREALRTRRWIPERFCYQALLRYLIWSFHVDVIPVTSQSILSFVNACKQPIQNLVLPEVVLLGFLLELRQINAIFGITLLGFLSSARCVN